MFHRLNHLYNFRLRLFSIQHHSAHFSGILIGNNLINWDEILLWEVSTFSDSLIKMRNMNRQTWTQWEHHKTQRQRLAPYLNTVNKDLNAARGSEVGTGRVLLAHPSDGIAMKTPASLIANPQKGEIICLSSRFWVCGRFWWNSCQSGTLYNYIIISYTKIHKGKADIQNTFIQEK